MTPAEHEAALASFLATSKVVMLIGGAAAVVTLTIAAWPVLRVRLARRLKAGRDRAA